MLATKKMASRFDFGDRVKGKFFIALGRAKVLDGKYTVWGRVVSGMEHLEKLPATTGTRAREMIKSLKVAN